MDAQDGRPAGGTRAAPRLHRRIEGTRYAYDHIDSLLLSDLQDPFLREICFALNELISFSDSFGHSFPDPPIPTDVRSKRSAYIY